MCALFVPLPVRETVAEVLTDVLGRQVLVQRDVQPLRPGSAGAVAVASFMYEGGRLAGVGVADTPFAAHAGAAFAGLPPERAQQAVDAGLDDELRGLLRHILDVLSRLLNSAWTDDVVLRDVRFLPGERLTGDTTALCTYPAGRQGYVVDIEGYGEGRLALLSW